MPAVELAAVGSKTEFVRALAQRGMRRVAEEQHRKSAFVRELARLWMSQQRSGPSMRSAEAQREAGLEVFRRVVVRDDGQRVRLRVLGHLTQARAALSARGRSFLRVLETYPDLLGPADFIREEVFHTRLLRHFLQPRPRSELGIALLDSFLALCVGAGGREVPGFSPQQQAVARVHAERVLAAQHRGKGRRFGQVDLWLDLPGFALLVEVKVDAKERPNQLTDYLEAARRARGDESFAVILLAADEELEPSSEEAGKLTLRSLLETWLPVAAAGNSGEHTYLRQYMVTLARMHGIGGEGEFIDWDWEERRSALAFIEELDG